MDKKKIIILLVFLLSGCADSEKEISCRLNNGNSHIDITIHTNYDDILSLNVKESFLLPYRYVLDDKIRIDMESQLDDTYCIYDNTLIHEYEIIPDDKYSLNKTVEYLGSFSYVCR